jgi:hypothetical protein
MAQSDKPTFFEALRTIAAEAMQDIRHKVVEEPWFGRETTKDDPAPMNMQHNHDHQHDHVHSHSHEHQHHKAESPYVKDGLPAMFDEYLAKHHGMGQDRQPEQEKAQVQEQQQSQQQEIER